MLSGNSGGRALLPRPGLVAPRKKDEEDFPKNIRGRDIEVVLESGDRDVAIQLNTRSEFISIVSTR